MWQFLLHFQISDSTAPHSLLHPCFVDKRSIGQLQALIPRVCLSTIWGKGFASLPGSGPQNKLRLPFWICQ